MTVFPSPLPTQPDKQGKPTYILIAEHIASDIQNGRWSIGTSLPSSRALAKYLGVHRNTILSAYDELRAQGLIQTKAGKGTFVAKNLSVHLNQQIKDDTVVPHYKWPKLEPFKATSPPKLKTNKLNLASSRPDLKLIPIKSLTRAFSRVTLRGLGHNLFSDGPPQGFLPLREKIAQLLASSRGITVEPSQIITTQGTQMSIYLLSRVLFRSGDRIAIEYFGHPPVWQAFRICELTLEPINIDQDGMLVADLEAKILKEKIKGIFLTPNRQFPTGVRLSNTRRNKILELANLHHIPVIEDDFDHEFQYMPQAIEAPLRSQDNGKHCIYLGTLSNLFAPGMRLSYIVAPQKLIEDICTYRSHLNQATNQSIESAMAELIDEGTLQRHIRRSTAIYQHRYLFIVEQLKQNFQQYLQFTQYNCGLSIWARLNKELCPETLHQDAITNNMLIYPAKYYAFDGKIHPFIRLGIGCADIPQIQKGLDILQELCNKQLTF